MCAAWARLGGPPTGCASNLLRRSTHCPYTDFTDLHNFATPCLAILRGRTRAGRRTYRRTSRSPFGSLACNIAPRRRSPDGWTAVRLQRRPNAIRAPVEAGGQPVADDGPDPRLLSDLPGASHSGGCGSHAAAQLKAAQPQASAILIDRLVGLPDSGVPGRNCRSFKTWDCSTPEWRYPESIAPAPVRVWTRPARVTQVGM
jgi:hypothetical protein